MPVCSVRGCGIRKTPNQPSITIHRIPRNEHKKKKWLEAIAMENIKPNVKDIYICSLHFDDKCFNKTLNVTRLRDDAVPFKFQHASQHKTGILKENQLETIPVLAGPDSSTLVPLKVANTSQHKTGILKENQLETIPVLAGPDSTTLGPLKVANTSTHNAPHAVAGTSGIATFILPMTTTAACTASFASVPGTSGIDNLPNQAQKELEDKCDYLRKRVKKLNDKVRRQKKKIGEFQNIIKDLQERNLVNNENSIVLDACAGPKDFLKRQILKSEGLPVEKQYSEETRKFALTLHLISPKAYNFVRRSYNTCLPHPRTLARWYQKIDEEPGLREEAIEALQNKVRASDTRIAQIIKVIANV